MYFHAETTLIRHRFRHCAHVEFDGSLDIGSNPS